MMVNPAKQTECSLILSVNIHISAGVNDFSLSIRENLARKPVPLLTTNFLLIPLS